MCTVSWALRTDGYVLFFNRDEMRTRRPETGPVIHSIRGVRFLAPNDGDHGGTWILVNGYGLTLGLLNHYPDQSVFNRSGCPSRGRLLMELADSVDPATLAGELEKTDLSVYPPFRIIGLSSSGLVLLTWDGRLLVRSPDGVEPPLTSSSFRPEEVRRHREALFPKDKQDAELERYHHCHDAALPAHSVLMARDDACTRSVTRIEVRGTEAIMSYQPQTWSSQPAASVEIRMSVRDPQIWPR